jgi:hydrophobic/amphiphilic exporter-1 (mainly G- bacteria), HAE1 family
LRWSLAHRKSTVAMAFASLLVAFGLATQVGGDFIPQEDNNWTSVQIQTPIGSSLEYTKSKAKQVEAVLAEFKEIKRINMNVWRTNAWFELQLIDKSQRRSQKELDDAIRARLKSIAGLEINIGFNRPIQIFVMGPDVRELDRISSEVIKRMRDVKGLVDIDTSFKPTNPSLDIIVNRELASDLGVSMNELGLTTRAMIAGEPAGQWQGPDGENHQVMVRLPRAQREGISDLDKIYVRANGVNSDGVPRMVPLRQVAEFQPSVSERRIDRRNMQRQVRIMSGITKDTNAGEMTVKVREITDSMTLPPGYRFQYGGSSAEMFETLGYAVGALAIAVIFIYLILASQFGSFLQPIAIMASLPLSLIGVVISLLLFGSNFNLFSVIGFIMLMGLVTKNAILLVDFTNQGIREGKTREQAILDAGQVRLRPIVMTTLAMIFGMIPLALAFGAGSEMQSPMAHAIIGGIITSTIMTLVVVPVLYTYMDSIGNRVSAWFAKGAPPEFHRDSLSGIQPNPTASSGGAAPVLQARKED